MRIVVTGSIAIDHLVAFLGRQRARMDEATQVEPHLPAAVSDAGTVR